MRRLLFFILLLFCFHLPAEDTRVGVIEIGGKKTPISQSTWIYVKSALEYYQEKPPKFIILHLNTPGGELFSSEQISDALKAIDFEAHIPVVAFIDNWAISAGALLAYSARTIVAVQDASMGAAEPVLAGEGGKMVTASEKVNSALRSDFANKARLFGRNPFLAEAMVDKDLIVVKRGEEIIKLAQEDQIKSTDEVISAKGKLLTLNGEQLNLFHVADYMLPLGASGIEALFTIAPYNAMQNVVIDRYEMDWKTRLLALVSLPAITSILFLGMMLGAYVEFNSPGFGVPGSVALLCLFLIIMGSYALDIIEVFELVLLGIGLLFILLDLFLIPTFGILGMAGVVMALVGVLALMLPGIGGVQYEWDTQTLNARGEAFFNRLSWLSASFVIGVIACGFLARFIRPNMSAFQRFVLSGNEESRFIAGADPTTFPKVGTEGIAYTDLRPSGKIGVDNDLFEAIAIGDYIQKGERVKIAEIDGSTLIVKRCE